VRRSCETAASISVRPATSFLIRSCIPLNACAAFRSSRGPFSAKGGAYTSTPRRSAARARTLKGAVRERTLRIDKAQIAAAISVAESRSWMERSRDGSTLVTA